MPTVIGRLERYRRLLVAIKPGRRFHVDRAMLVFLGDLHLGRGSPEASRQAELDAVALLEASTNAMLEPGGGLVLVGDVFDAYIEYESLVPSGFVRLQGALARLVDQGVQVKYVVGNRDPWHRRHFEREIGVQVIPESLTLQSFGKKVVITHGDRYATSEFASRALRPILRNPLAYWLYRHLLPGDSGYRLARWAAADYGDMPEPPIDADLRSAARAILADSDVDLVVMGHCHLSELLYLPGGAYLNTGYWFADRTFGVLDIEGPRLLRWDLSNVVEPLKASHS